MLRLLIERMIVTHSSELGYVFGEMQPNTTASTLSGQMIDYWLSFATSLDPNDGKGSQREIPSA
jgi:acetylcholinesterase